MVSCKSLWSPILRVSILRTSGYSSSVSSQTVNTVYQVCDEPRGSTCRVWSIGSSAPFARNRRAGDDVFAPLFANATIHVSFSEYTQWGKNRIIIDVDLTALLCYHTPPCDRNHASCDARMNELMLGRRFVPDTLLRLRGMHPGVASSTSVLR